MTNDHLILISARQKLLIKGTFYVGKEPHTTYSVNPVCLLSLVAGVTRFHLEDPVPVPGASLAAMPPKLPASFQVTVKYGVRF